MAGDAQGSEIGRLTCFENVVEAGGHLGVQPVFYEMLVLRRVAVRRGGSDGGGGAVGRRRSRAGVGAAPDLRFRLFAAHVAEEGWRILRGPGRGRRKGVGARVRILEANGETKGRPVQIGRRRPLRFRNGRRNQFGIWRVAILRNFRSTPMAETKRSSKSVPITESKT